MSATGRVGNDRAEQIWFHDPITKEKVLVFDKGKRIKFKGFKNKDAAKFEGIVSAEEDATPTFPRMQLPGPIPLIGPEI